MPGKVKALIVDDSAYMRVVLKDMLEADPDTEVIGTAKDGLEAVEKSKALEPDVVLLDIQMPRMDGIATLQRIMKEAPTRVIMLSAMDKVDEQLPLRALEMGAVDFISKPSGPVSIEIVNFSSRIIDIVRTAALAKVDVLKKARAPLPHRLKVEKMALPRSRKIVAIGASTGGPRALESIFAALPPDIPTSLFIVQHIPQEFSYSFAKRLDSTKGPQVVLVSHEIPVDKGTAYLAPGGKHLKLRWRGATTLLAKPDDGEPVNFVKPSVDVLFKSAAECLEENVMAVVLTGMGSDGAMGAKAIKAVGGRVIVQDEESSVVHGMPKSVIDAGAADKTLSLEEIPEEIINWLEE